MECDAGMMWAMSAPRKHQLPTPGDTFGRLTVQATEHNKRWFVICECECGNIAKVREDHLRSGRSTSCGCLRAEVSSQRNKIHGKTDSPLHRCWVGIRNRTRNQGSSVFQHYGGRGVSVSSDWDTFEAFEEWALNNGWQQGLELDRIDNSGDYSPDNCQWVTHKQNMRNTRANRRVSAFGETKVLAEWVEDERCVVSYGTLHSRLRSGWDAERAIMETI